MQKMDNKGFSIIELIIAIAILSVLTGITAYSFENTKIKTLEKKYMTEASAVFRAANLYLFDCGMREDLKDIDEIDIYTEIMKELDDKMHVLKPYLSGTHTKGAYIRLLGIKTGAPLAYALDDIEYMVSGYLIKVDRYGEITILSYPEGMEQSKRK